MCPMVQRLHLQLLLVPLGICAELKQYLEGKNNKLTFYNLLQCLQLGWRILSAPSYLSISGIIGQSPCSVQDSASWLLLGCPVLLPAICSYSH